MSARLAVFARDGQPQLPDHVGQLLVGVEAGHAAGGTLVLLPFGGAPRAAVLSFSGVASFTAGTFLTAGMGGACCMF